MTAKASPKENLLRALRRQGFDEVPLDPSAFCASQLEAFKKRFGHDRVMSFFNAPFRDGCVPLSRVWRDPKALFPREELPPNCEIDDWGVGHSRHEGCFHMTRMHHPLAGDPSLDEVASYPLPLVSPDAFERAKLRVEECHARGLAARASMACTVWEIAWYIRSMEDLMVDMMSGDERAAVHLDRVTRLTEERARLAAKAGFDIIQTGDDIGMQNAPMMSLELWRTWIKPRFARVVAAAKAVKPDILIFYHSCGFVLPFIDELIEIGVDILNPVQPECMSFEEVASRFGDRLSFWGTIGTQTTLPHGTPEEVENVVSSRLRVCGAKGGIVIGPTHMVEPEVPWENMLALKKACESFKL